MSFLVKQSFTIDIDSRPMTMDNRSLGEGRLGSTSRESFTDNEEGTPNCFSCHDTNAVRHNGAILGTAPSVKFRLPTPKMTAAEASIRPRPFTSSFWRRCTEYEDCPALTKIQGWIFSGSY